MEATRSFIISISSSLRYAYYKPKAKERKLLPKATGLYQGYINFVITILLSKTIKKHTHTHKRTV